MARPAERHTRPGSDRPRNELHDVRAQPHMEVADGDESAVVHVAIDQEIARLAARQRGLVTREQLLALDLGRGAIAHRLARERLHAVHRGTYLVGHPVPPPLALETAALLACGDGAVLSHATAAVLWGIEKGTLATIDVTVVGRRVRSVKAVRVHYAQNLPSTHIRRRHGLPLTSPAHTLLDRAAIAMPRALERAVAEAHALGLLRDGELEDLVARSPGRRGVAALRALVAREAGPALTRSQAEERLLSLIRRARLPEPECNGRVAGHEVDFLWRASRLVVEVDGYAFHGSRAAFERDRRRDTDLQAAGLTVARLTWRRLVDEPEAVVAQLARACSG